MHSFSLQPRKVCEVLNSLDRRLPRSEKCTHFAAFCTERSTLEESLALDPVEDDAVFPFIHQGFGFLLESFDLRISQFTFENAVLNPREVAPKQLEHAANALFSDIVYGNVVSHGRATTTYGSLRRHRFLGRAGDA
jgi:hypothetical protein